MRSIVSNINSLHVMNKVCLMGLRFQRSFFYHRPMIMSDYDRIMSRILKETMRTWTDAIELVDLGEKKLLNTTNQINKTVTFYRRKCYNFA